MNENTEKYLKLLKKHVDRIAIVVLYLFLGALVLIWWKEQDSGNEPPPSGKPAVIDIKVEENPFWSQLQAMATPQTMESYPSIKQIRQYNMFDYKSVKDAQALLQIINQKFAQAEELEKAGKKEEAVRLLKEVLSMKPNYSKAKDLLQKLDPKKTEDAPAGAAEAVAAPAEDPVM